MIHFLPQASCIWAIATPTASTTDLWVLQPYCPGPKPFTASQCALFNTGTTPSTTSPRQHGLRVGGYRGSDSKVSAN